MAVEVLLILSFELKIFIGYDPELFKLFIKTINRRMNSTIIRRQRKQK